MESRVLFTQDITLVENFLFLNQDSLLIGNEDFKGKVNHSLEKTMENSFIFSAQKITVKMSKKILNRLILVGISYALHKN